MKKYKYNHGISPELDEFPHIAMIGKDQVLDSSSTPLSMHYNNGIEICFIQKGRFEWTVEKNNFVMFPGDCTITLPWEWHGGTKGILDRGELTWIIIRPQIFTKAGVLKLGEWSNIPEAQQSYIGKVLAESKKNYFTGDLFFKEVFEKLVSEITSKAKWRTVNANRLLDELISLLPDCLTNSSITRKNAFYISQIEKIIKEDFSRKWNLSDLEKISGYGKSMLNKILRRETGYSSINYVTSLRVKNAMELLKDTNYSLGRIALDCGFTNSQQFSMTFKKFTGKTPSKFRKNTNRE